MTFGMDFRRAKPGVIAIAVFQMMVLGCEKKAESPEPPKTELQKLQERGKVVYMTQCTACHAQDPQQNGGVGPAIAGSSVELLRAKVLKNEYPEGYKPKRETKAMIALPHLEKDIDALAAFLQQGQ